MMLFLASVDLLASVDFTTTGVALQLGLILSLVFLSGLFSGSEAVLFSLTPTELQRDILSNNPLRRLVGQVMQSPKNTLATILVANTAVNVLLFSVSYVFFSKLSGQYGDWITPVSAVASILLVLVFGEVIPKVLGVAMAQQLAPGCALLVRVSSFAFGPIGRLLDFLVIEPFHRLFFPQAERVAKSHRLEPDEIKTLLELNRQRGLLNADEDTLLRELIDLSGVRVRDLMVPRVEMVAFDIDDPREQLLAMMRETHLKKLPVYEGEIDQVVGLVYAKTAVFNPEEPLQKLISPVHYVPDVITAEQVLLHFRDTRSQLAIVVDEYGSVSGLVTLEDVLEEIVGEIRGPDEDSGPAEVITISETEYDLSGSLSVQFWAETFGLPPMVGRIATVGGLVVSQLGRPARVGDIVQIQNVELKVTEVQRRRVQRIYLRLIEDAELVSEANDG